MHSVAARMQLAHTPLGARVAAAAVARGRVEDARSDHGAQSRLPQRLAPVAPSSVVWACEAAGEAGHRARRGHWVMRARTMGLPNSRPGTIGLTFYPVLTDNFGGSASLYETVCAYRYSTGKKTPGGAGTHTGHADTQRHTDSTDEPHNHPNPPTTHNPHVTARRPKPRPTQEPQARSRPPPRPTQKRPPPANPTLPPPAPRAPPRACYAPARRRSAKCQLINMKARAAEA